ncbi:hypothetical protein GCM10009672_15000 [Nesterenkonia lutea]
MQENINPSGAEDQGIPSDEIAADEDDQQPADLAEIEEEIWESSMSQESVNIQVLAGLERGHELFGYAPDFFEAEGESFEMQVTGEIEGDSVTELNYVPDFQVLTSGDETYQTVEAFVFDYEAQVPPEVDPEPDAAQLDAELSAEGEWVDVTDSEPAVPRTPAALLELLRTELEESLGVSSLSELELASAVDTREGENVWVYSDEQVELAVLADEGSPQLVGVTIFGEDQDFTATFTQWNEAEAPEAPADDLIIDQEQLQEILNGFVGPDQG